MKRSNKEKQPLDITFKAMQTTNAQPFNVLQIPGIIIISHHRQWQGVRCSISKEKHKNKVTHVGFEKIAIHQISLLGLSFFHFHFLMP